MPGLVSLLDEKHDALVKKIWQELESDCGLEDIYVTPLPHFSWQIADDYEWDALKITVKDIARVALPFRIQTAGFALFTSESPVAYIPIVRTKRLSEFHEMIWNRLASISINSSPYYAPSSWMPHITLANGDVDIEKIHCLTGKMVHRPINWDIEINNLTLIYEVQEKIGVTKIQYTFGKKESDRSNSQ